MKWKWTAALLAAALCLTLAVGCGKTESKSEQEAFRDEFLATAENRRIEEAEGTAAQQIRETEGNVLISVDYPSVASAPGASAELKAFAESALSEFRTAADAIGGDGGAVCGFMMTYKPYLTEEGLLSVKFTANTMLPGAEQKSDVTAFVYDLEADRKLSLADVFAAGQDYLTPLSEKAQAYLRENEALTGNMDETLFTGGTAPSEENYTNFSITPNKIVFYFNSGRIAAAQAGCFEVGIPLDAVAAFLNPEGKASGGAVEAPPMGTQAPAQTDIPQLQPRDGFMTAKSIEGIDPLSDKVIALTFDDGPHAENTPKLLDILKENGVVATFFMLGQNVEKHPDIAKRVYEEGHEIGTHSWDHTKNWPKLSVGEKLDQYTKANDAIEAATGLRSIIDRPPGGAVTEAEAASIGREQIIWSMDPKDWVTDFRDPDIIYSNVMNGGEGGGAKEVEGYLSDGGVILSHDIHATTVDAYDRIIKELKSQGYRFVTITQMMQIAEARGGDLSKFKFSKAPQAEDA